MAGVRAPIDAGIVMYNMVTVAQAKSTPVMLIVMRVSLMNPNASLAGTA